MAKYSHRIQADRRTVTSRGMYIYGNTVRQAEVMPQRQEEPRKEHKKKKLDRQILKNRRKAMRMNPAYVMFLSIAAVAALVVCMVSAGTCRAYKPDRAYYRAAAGTGRCKRREYN